MDLDSTFMAIKYAYPECAKHGVDSIINITSLAALQASGPIVYSVAKGAVKSMSRTVYVLNGTMANTLQGQISGLIIIGMGITLVLRLRKLLESQADS